MWRWRYDEQGAEKRQKEKDKVEKDRGNTERETRGKYCSVNGTQSNFLLLKKSFIYVDSLLVMYSSVNPPKRTHTVRLCVNITVCSGCIVDASWREERQF